MKLPICSRGVAVCGVRLAWGGVPVRSGGRSLERRVGVAEVGLFHSGSCRFHCSPPVCIAVRAAGVVWYPSGED